MVGVPEIFMQQFKDLVMNWIWEVREGRDVKDSSSFLHMHFGDATLEMRNTRKQPASWNL